MTAGTAGPQGTAPKHPAGTAPLHLTGTAPVRG